MVKTIQRKENIEMCFDNGVSKILKEGVVIDARFPLNMELAYEVLIREGYNKKKDFLYITTQYEHQYTELKYNKTATYIDEKTQQKEYVIFESIARNLVEGINAILDIPQGEYFNQIQYDTLLGGYFQAHSPVDEKVEAISDAFMKALEGIE